MRATTMYRNGVLAQFRLVLLVVAGCALLLLWSVRRLQCRWLSDRSARVVAGLQRALQALQPAPVRHGLASRPAATRPRRRPRTAPHLPRRVNA